MRNLINDGYTEQGYIEAVERQHAAIRFTFRPMLPVEVQSVQRVIDTGTPEDQTVAIAAAIVDHVTDWDQGVPVSLENVRRLKWRPFHRIYNTIAGFVPSDPIPGAGKAEEGDYVQKILKQHRTGKLPVEELAADEKNSAKG